jgi:hypothetical protein
VWRALQTRNYDRERGQGFPGAVCFALLEIITGLAHGVGDMGEAKHSHSGRTSKCVKGRRFHLDRKDAFGARSLDGVCSLPKGRIGGRARAHHAVKSAFCQCYCYLLHKSWASLRELGRRRIMVTGPFIAAWNGLLTLQVLAVYNSLDHWQPNGRSARSNALPASPVLI